MISLSSELKNKIKNCMLPSTETHFQTMQHQGMNIKIPTYIKLVGTVKFYENELHLYRECISWSEKIIDGDFDKINIGRFSGISPIDFNHSEVNFSIDKYEQESWKDWFIIDD